MYKQTVIKFLPETVFKSLKDGGQIHKPSSSERACFDAKKFERFSPIFSSFVIMFQSFYHFQQFFQFFSKFDHFSLLNWEHILAKMLSILTTFVAQKLNQNIRACIVTEYGHGLQS
jgi:hypothetical protein